MFDVHLTKSPFEKWKETNRQTLIVKNKERLRLSTVIEKRGDWPKYDVFYLCIIVGSLMSQIVLYPRNMQHFFFLISNFKRKYRLTCKLVNYWFHIYLHKVLRNGSQMWSRICLHFRTVRDQPQFLVGFVLLSL